MKAMQISLTALDVEWKRLEIISENLANANVANSAAGVTFRAQHLISGPKTDFAALLDTKNPNAAGIDVEKLTGVQELGVEASTAPPRLVHEPGNPQANADGYVSYPAVDQASEMTQMIRTSRSYEANIVAMQSAREMYAKALQIGERQ
jgi:flagellar basal-body rod protein FlgC